MRTHTNQTLFGSSRSSLKGRQALADGRAEAVVRHGQRQVRIRGELRLDESKATESFRRVAPSAQHGLAVLQQGAPIDEAGWSSLAAKVDASLERAGEVPPPDDYVAFILTPRTIEFYNGGHPNYLNDRFLYVRAMASCDFAAPMRLQA